MNKENLVIILHSEHSNSECDAKTIVDIESWSHDTYFICPLCKIIVKVGSKELKQLEKPTDEQLENVEVVKTMDKKNLIIIPHNGQPSAACGTRTIVEIKSWSHDALFTCPGCPKMVEVNKDRYYIFKKPTDEQIEGMIGVKARKKLDTTLIIEKNLTVLHIPNEIGDATPSILAAQLRM